MPTAASPSVLLCYVSGLDRRRIDATVTPTLHRLLGSVPTVRIRGFPDTELVSTIFAGTYPPEHGIFHVRLRPGRQKGSRTKGRSRVPDRIATTAQCIRHALTGGYDLAAVPPGRRRDFELTRFKYNVRDTAEQARRAPEHVGAVPSLFGVLGDGASSHVLNLDLKKLSSEADTLLAEPRRLEVLEVRCLDILQHWYLDRPERIAGFYAEVDRVIAQLEERCSERGVALMILSDHGQEPVARSIDLPAALATLGLDDREYSYFLEVPMARFWFHSDRAGERIRGMLAAMDVGTLLESEEMARFGLRFHDNRYGEVFFVTDPGCILFPNDFYHPLANIYLALTEWQHRPRLADPRQRGYHAHLPHHPSEEGFLLLIDSERWLDEGAEGRLIDVAPTALALLGTEIPTSMSGRSLLAC